MIAMPTKSAKQHNFMAAVAHNPAFAKKVGVVQSVGRDFTQADKRRYAEGGDVGAVSGRASTKYKNRLTDEQKEENADRFGDVAGMMVPGLGPAKTAKTALSKVRDISFDRSKAELKRGFQTEASRKIAESEDTGYKRGGSVHRGDGIAQRGRTRARFITS